MDNLTAKDPRESLGFCLAGGMVYHHKIVEDVFFVSCRVCRETPIYPAIGRYAKFIKCTNMIRTLVSYPGRHNIVSYLRYVHEKESRT
jgi:hypothetical protein